MKPDAVPSYGLILADYLAAQDDSKPTAGNTRFRHSDAGSCGRSIALTAAEVEPSNPAQPSGRWQMNIGTYGHEVFQAAMAEHFGEKVGCEVDALWSDGFDGSGHSDTLWLHAGRTLGEVKTMGGYGWDLAVGIGRKARKRTDPQGPKVSALIQGALNALALDCDELVVICLSNENISDSLATQLGLSEIERFYAQWTFPREVWEPWAVAEKARVSKILALLDEGNLADRYWIADGFVPTRLRGTENFPCGYCRHRDTCVLIGPGVAPVAKLAVAKAWHGEAVSA